MHKCESTLKLIKKAPKNEKYNIGKIGMEKSENCVCILLPCLDLEMEKKIITKTGENEGEKRIKAKKKEIHKYKNKKHMKTRGK